MNTLMLKLSQREGTMEKKENKKHILNGFFDNCKDFYMNGGKKDIGSNFMNPFDKDEIAKEESYAEYKLNQIRKILLE